LYAFNYYLDPNGKRIPSGYQSKQMLLKMCPNNYTRFDCCPDGCHMFLDDDKTACPICKKDRRVDNKSAAYVNITSIGSIIAGKIANPITRQQMRYRHERSTPADGRIDDIFDGSVYRDLVNNNYFGNPDDVAIGLFVDGFNPFKHSTFKANLVNMVIFNNSPTARYVNLKKKKKKKKKN
jgi:RNA polymerase subunit RPABC4/transcription elongation factor Spt4